MQQLWKCHANWKKGISFLPIKLKEIKTCMSKKSCRLCIGRFYTKMDKTSWTSSTHCNVPILLTFLRYELHIYFDKTEQELHVLNILCILHHYKEVLYVTVRNVLSLYVGFGCESHVVSKSWSESDSAGKKTRMLSYGVHYMVSNFHIEHYTLDTQSV